MTITLHSLKVTPGAKKSRKRVGRGESSGQGKTSGSGHKGQWARKGHKFKGGFEGGQMKLIRRIPKTGFKNFTRPKTLAVNMGDLNCFDNGTDVTLELLKKSGLTNGVFDRIKILGKGILDKKLTVKAHAFSASVKARIEALGGKCEVLPV